jgi:uncharacterized protein (TIGR00375 family)
MGVQEIARYAKIKGLTIVGTGDFTHPKWMNELQKELFFESDLGLYRAAQNPDTSIRFIITTEVSTVFSFANGIKKVHHVILTPTLETAVQINERLSKLGNLASDGRPTLNMDAAHLVEEVMGVTRDNMVFPAHAWTPWFGVLGASSGFNAVEECYQDMTKYICALETGLSSDPPMNWRLSKLDRLTLVSNSDSHSFWPWRIGREANLFEFEKPSYHELIETIRSKDKHKFRFTIETDPAYGKYHLTGHRNCHVSFSSQEALKFGNICPVCRKRLTKGVEQRVEELADRPMGFKPENAVDFIHLLPLSEILQTVLTVDSPTAQRVWSVYNKLIGKFGCEYSILLDVSEEDLDSVAGKEIARAIVRVREGSVRVIPGYDGVYGRMIISEDQFKDKKPTKRIQPLNLTDF